MNVTNLSGQPEGLLRSWLPHGLQAEQVVFLPDACPGKSPLPTGTVVLTRQPDWRRFAISDCGCGMRLLRSTLKGADLTQAAWDDVASRLRANKGRLGDLGGGNHFLDALLPYDEDVLHFLVHTGSRTESGLVDGLVDRPGAFEREFRRIVDWAQDNRAAVAAELERVLGPMTLVLDAPHNTFEGTNDGTVIRKGAVKVKPGELAVIPSHLSGEVALVRATPAISDIFDSLSHGTGRKMSRVEAKALAVGLDFAALRKAVLMPAGLADASLSSEGPHAYRDLDECLALLAPYVEPVRRFAVVAFMGHL